MGGAVFRLRNIASRLLPVLVVVWATVAVLGGAIYLANHDAGPPDGETAAKAGLGLCAVSVAIFAGKAVRRVVPPPFAAGLGLMTAPPRPHGPPAHGAILGPPATGPPILLLLQVSRT